MSKDLIYSLLELPAATDDVGKSQVAAIEVAMSGFPKVQVLGLAIAAA